MGIEIFPSFSFTLLTVIVKQVATEGHGPDKFRQSTQSVIDGTMSYRYATVFVPLSALVTS